MHWMRMGAVGTVAMLSSCLPSLRADTSNQPNAADATGRSGVAAVEGPTSPLIVDWNPEQRADLEEAIRDGVAVVAYDEEGMKLLKGCKLSGDYGYIGVTTKTQVVRLETVDDIRANLPLSGMAIAGTIGAEMEQGATLDIAMVMVGKKRTTWEDVTDQDLEGGGKCDGATHYVRGITVGAFAMKTGTKQKARAAAEIFGIGAGAGTQNTSKVDNTDGKMEACDEAEPEADKPPSQCGALLRVELEPIVAKADVASEKGDEPDATPEVESRQVTGCPPGFVFVEGKCTRDKGDAPHLCKPGDASDCKSQCEKGNAQSCDHYGVLVARGKASGNAEEYFEKGCKGGSPSACRNLGIRKLAADRSAAMTSLERACRDGDARSCGIAAHQFFPGSPGKQDERRALGLYSAGCNGGDQSSCTNLALMYGGAAKSIPIDDDKALRLSERACNGGIGTACGNAGLRYEMGMGVAQDFPRAARLFDRACRLNPGDCFRLAILHQHGGGVSRDDRRAKELFQRACRSGGGGLQAMSCFLLGEVFKDKGGSVSKGAIQRTLGYMQPQCDKKVVRACSFVGVMQLAQGGPLETKGRATLKKACKDRDAWACDLVKRLRL